VRWGRRKGEATANANRKGWIMCRRFFTSILPSSFQVALVRDRTDGGQGNGGRRGGGGGRNQGDDEDRFQLRERMLMHTRLIDNVVASH